MTIVLVGGGSGGHITPLLAVAAELKKQQPTAKLIYIGEKSGSFFDLAKDSTIFDGAFAIPAGKFRRYNGQSFLAHLFDIKTNLLNLRDSFRVARGYRQSKKLLAKLKPDIAFIKGGFVGVPTGKACAKLGIPYITHDSDTVPGLANRLIAKNAFLHTVGMPKEFYDYPPEKTEVVGIPLADEYEKVTPRLQEQYRRKLQLPTAGPVIFVTGGSLGAQQLNTYMAYVAEELLQTHPDLIIIHQVGKGNLGVYSQLSQELQARVMVREFVNDMFYYSGAADIVVTRAGATTIAELAVQGKACILVPNPYLTGGHQLRNAEMLAKSEAVKVVHEQTLNQDPEALLIAIRSLLADQKEREMLVKALQRFAHPESAKNLATIIFESIAYVQEQKKGVGG